MTGDPLRRGAGLIGAAVVEAHPSLALIKYWGKADAEENLPATPSLAVTLEGLTTRTTVELAPSAPPVRSDDPADPDTRQDRVFIGGELQPSGRFEPFFRAFRSLAARSLPSAFSVTARSSSDYPSSAGLASSSAGFAALAKACAAAAGLNVCDGELSAVARVGSASAARSIFGGFVRLDAGADEARPVKDADWWPDLRIVVVEVEPGPKPVSTRTAMESVRTTSPFYRAWLEDAPGLMEGALAALEARKLDVLGPLVRRSYMRMFGTMLSADPPIVYWKPDSLGLIAACGRMRRDGLDAWETMDAGPQVKILCLEEELEAVDRRLESEFPSLPRRICRVGRGAEVIGEP